jgi:hypothetical protein
VDEALFTVFKLDNHDTMKPMILSAINKMKVNSIRQEETIGVHGVLDEAQSISNSDWDLPRDTERPYYPIIYPVFEHVCKAIKDKYKYHMHLKVDNYWFQQYKTSDFHSWHIHQGGLFSCVYYVELNSDLPKTSFNILGEAKDMEVSEGQILVFPSYLLHCSKPNKNKKTKTIISFNINAVHE